MTHPADTLRSGGSETPTAEVARLIRGLREDLVLFRELLAKAPPSTPPPALPPAAPLSSQLTLGNAAKWFFLANGVLECGVQIAAIFKPELVGPLQALRMMLRGTSP